MWGKTTGPQSVLKEMSSFICYRSVVCRDGESRQNHLTLLMVHWIHKVSWLAAGTPSLAGPLSQADRLAGNTGRVHAACVLQVSCTCACMRACACMIHGAMAILQ